MIASFQTSEISYMLNQTALSVSYTSIYINFLCWPINTLGQAGCKIIIKFECFNPTCLNIESSKNYSSQGDKYSMKMATTTASS